jgi:hypothetical protein
VSATTSPIKLSRPVFIRSESLPHSSHSVGSVGTGSLSVPCSSTPSTKSMTSHSNLDLLRTVPVPPSADFDAKSVSCRLRGMEGYVSFCDVAGLGCPSLDDEPEEVVEAVPAVTPTTGISPSTWLPTWLWNVHH